MTAIGAGNTDATGAIENVATENVPVAGCGYEAGEGSGSREGSRDDADGDATETPHPYEGKLFETLEQLLDFYHEYGRSHGFQVRIRTIEQHGRRYRARRDDAVGMWDEDANRCRLVCSKAGEFKSKSKNPNYRARSMKSHCEAKLNAWKKDDGFWRVSKFVDRHNHELIVGNVRFMASFRGIGAREKGRLVVNNTAGIPMNKNYQSLIMDRGGYGNTPFTEKDARNLMDKYRRLVLKDGDYSAMEEVFEKMARQCRDFTHAKDTNEEGRLRNVFWVDGRSRAAFKDFGDVVSFDATYLKNRYRMSFTPFIGVNHHGQSILFGCALISSEDTRNYTWLFKQWKRAMGGKEPLGIITDQCQAMGNAIAEVFPDTRHRWCLWHVLRNAKRHLHHYENWEELFGRLQSVIYNTLTHADFEKAWEEFIKEFALSDNKWLCDMYGQRHMWIPVYFKDSFWAGMSSTQRSEGMNNFFKSFVNLNSTLVQFAEQFNLALAKRVDEEAELTFRSKNAPLRRCSDYPFEVVFQETYTNKKLEEFQDQIRASQYCVETKVKGNNNSTLYSVEDKTKECLWFRPEGVHVRVLLRKSPPAFKCECKNFEFRGILCRHIVRVLHVAGIDYIPKEYVLDRWRKDISRNYLTYNIPHYAGVAELPDPSPITEMREKFEEVAHMMTGNPDAVNEFLSRLEAWKAQAGNGVDPSSRIMSENLDGIGWVYRRKKRIAAGGEGEANDNNDQAENGEQTPTPVVDPVDQRRRGRAPGHRAGYNNENKGKKKAKAAPSPNARGKSRVDEGIYLMVRPPSYGMYGISPLLSPSINVVQNQHRNEGPQQANTMLGTIGLNSGPDYMNRWGRERLHF